ncbi:hypothetical protein ACF0H5_013933 [Mactra antiquata]
MSQKRDHLDPPCTEALESKVLPQDLDQNYYDRRSSMFTRSPEVHRFRFSSPLNIARRSTKPKQKSDSKCKRTKIASIGHESDGLATVDDKDAKRRRGKKKKCQKIGSVIPNTYKTMINESHLNFLKEWFHSGNRLPRICEHTTGFDYIPEEGLYE